MKRTLQAALTATLMLGSAFAFAKPPHPPGPPHGQPPPPHHDDRGPAHHDDRDRHDNGNHYGQAKHAWRKGEHAPREYLGDRYYVRDYRSYKLAPPPRGYRWVRPEPESDRFLLIQATSGLISQVFGY